MKSYFGYQIHRAGGKWPYENYFQKNLPVSLFPSDLPLLVVKISRACNWRTR